MHWICKIALSRRFTVIAPDLPLASRRRRRSRGRPTGWLKSSSTVRCCGAGIGPTLAGFSFGGVISGNVAAELGGRLRRFVVVGSNGMGLERSPTTLERVAPDASEEQEFATHRYNLNQLMIADPGKIDELALYLQKTNHARARMRSRRFSRSDALAAALPRVTARLDGIWGERDATAFPHVEERARILRSVQPEARFAVIPGAGHWVQFEAANHFNEILAEFAAS